MKPTLLLIGFLFVTHSSPRILAGETPSVPDLAEKLKSGVGEDTRSRAAEELGKLGGSAHSAVPVLTQALASDTAPAVRHNAAWALGKIKNPEKETIPALIKALEDPEWTVRHNAALSLTWIGRSTMDPLKTALSAENPVRQVYALSALAAISPEEAAREVSRIGEFLKNESPGIRSLAAEIAGNLGPRAEGAVAGLSALLKDADPAMRGRALDALGKIGKSAHVAIPALIEVLKSDKERSNKIAAAVALGSAGSDSPIAIEALVAALGDKDSRVRSYSSSSLASIGTPAVAKLEEAMRSEDDRVRMHTAMALGGMEGAAKPAITSLVAGLTDPEVQVRTSSAAALGSIGDGSVEVKNALQQARDREANDPVVKAYIEKALSMLK